MNEASDESAIFQDKVRIQEAATYRNRNEEEIFMEKGATLWLTKQKQS